jgi:hypothetical protein
VSWLPAGKGEAMTAKNFDNFLNTLAERTPFQVFRVDLNGGRRFEVDHPRALVVRDGVAVFLAPGGYPIWFDHESVNQIIGAPAGTVRRKKRR